MKLSKVCKRSSIMTLALAAIIALVAVFPCTAVAAGPDECNLIGTWAGNAGNDMHWLAVHTAGSTKNGGTMLMDWVYINKNLLNVVGTLPEGSFTRLTPGRGVWEKIAEGKYNYTWYAYGIYEMPDSDDDGINEEIPMYIVRVTGTATSDGCDTINIDYYYEIRKAEGWPPQGMDDGNWDLLYSTSGHASEYRVKVVEP